MRHMHRNSPECFKMKNELSVGAGASSIQPTWYPLVIEGPNTELNPLSHLHRNSPECWEMKKKCKMSPVFELVLHASSQLWNPLVNEGPNIEVNALSYAHRNSPEY
jgi:hypothetical protein